MLKIGIICGGPSRERGISLNSARSLLDHTSFLEIEAAILYVNSQGLYFLLTPSQLYSNTPSDFDFKLGTASLDETSLLAFLHSQDLIFPTIHGTYGEDGTLQDFLERHSIPYVGSGSRACRTLFNKGSAHRFFNNHGFSALPYQLITSKEVHTLPYPRAIIKPTLSGSSLGVTLIDSLEAAQTAVLRLWNEGFHELLIEPYCEDREFTVCVLESHRGPPQALVPLEIDIGASEILDYRKKYLPTEQTRYYCPPRFSQEAIAQIQREAERLFATAELHDFVRVDGWLSADGEVRFSDLNPISGLEQNSFLFQQAARVGITHGELIKYILQTALNRYGIQKPLQHRSSFATQRQLIYVLMGGETSERQVSLMSGTNVWLKLRQAERYETLPFLLDSNQQVWQLPYAFALHHTVEEIQEHCSQAQNKVDQIAPAAAAIRHNLGLSPLPAQELPRLMDLSSFLAKVKQDGAFLFLGLHGGIGEDGTLQQLLEDATISFNGSSAHTSRLCMDKHKTALCIKSLCDPMILPMPQISFYTPSSSKAPKRVELKALAVELILLGAFELEGVYIGETDKLWEKAVALFHTDKLIIKPQCDGCSTGVARLHTLQELDLYIDALRQGLCQLPAGTLEGQLSPIEMPLSTSQPFLLEPFIQTDKIRIENSTLQYQRISGWIEMTLGILEQQGSYLALNPSITIAESHVLSLEEKFQGGTGINITPPPDTILSPDARRQVRASGCRIAEALGVQDYVRIDLFVECATGKVRLIEANTLPALTPSTVLYHQALSLSPPLPPRELLERLVEGALSKRCP